jgi:hypothetical protein
VDTLNSLCLIAANLAVARRAFDLVGGFSTDLGGAHEHLGSNEDHELLVRLFEAGEFGIYDPRIVVHAEVQPDRLDRSYHRRWYTGSGHFHALMRPGYLERSHVGRLFDVPAHMYRAAIADTLAWVGAKLRGNDLDAFTRELRLRFFSGFLRTRRRQFRELAPEARRLQWRDLVRGLVCALVRRPNTAREASGNTGGIR